MVYAAPGRVFRVALVNDPQPHLVSLKESTTDRQWRGRAVATGEVLYVPATAIGGDALLLLATSDLQPISEVPLAGRVLFGPHPFEEGVLVADEQKLLAVGKEGTRWQLDLNGYTPVGRPLLHENRIVLVTTAGRILLLDPSAGTVIRSFDLGEPLATGAVHFSQDRFVVQSADGTVHIVTLKAP